MAADRIENCEILIWQPVTTQQTEKAWQIQPGHEDNIVIISCNLRSWDLWDDMFSHYFLKWPLLKFHLKRLRELQVLFVSSLQILLDLRPSCSQTPPHPLSSPPPHPSPPPSERQVLLSTKRPHPDTFIRDILSAVKRTKGHISHFGQKTSAPHYAVWPWQLVFILWVLQVSARQRDEPSDPGVYFKVSDGKQLFEHHDSFLLSDLDLILNYICLITQQVWTEKFPLWTKRFLMEIQQSASAESSRRQVHLRRGVDCLQCEQTGTHLLR